MSDRGDALSHRGRPPPEQLTLDLGAPTEDDDLSFHDWFMALPKTPQARGEPSPTSPTTTEQTTSRPPRRLPRGGGHKQTRPSST